jgi:hypothetical protein
MSTSGTKPIAINIHSVTADGIKSSQRAASDPKGKGKAKEKKDKMSDLLAEEVVRGIMKKGKKEMMSSQPVSREQKEFISRGNKFDPKKVDPNFVTPEEKEAAWYARTIFKYYQAFPEKLGKMPTVKAIDPSAPGALGKLREHLSQIQSVMGSSFSEEVSTIGLATLGTTVEFAWQMFCYQQPWNPLGGLDLSNLGAETAQLYSYFEDELKELQILYADWLEQGVWTRFFSKFFMVVKEVAVKNANRSAQANESAQKMASDPQYADL